MSLAYNSSSTLSEFVCKHMDGGRYYALYPDVEAHGIAAGSHWLKHGMYEGRTFPAHEFHLFSNNLFESRYSTHDWNWFDHDDGYVAIRKKLNPSNRIVEQIRKQSAFEPALLAAGHDAIANLRSYYAKDVLYRDGIDVTQLYESITALPKAVIVLPSLKFGGTVKYAADLFRSLHSNDIEDILVIVTEQSREAAGKWLELEAFTGFEPAKIVFWQDNTMQHAAQNPIAFARFLASLNCSHIFVINSALGLGAIEMFGRGLSQRTRIYCAFFNISINYPGAYHSAYFPRKIAAFATCVTDHVIMARHLTGLYGSILSKGVTVLPPVAEISRPLEFTSKLRTRLSRLHEKRKQKHWSYIGRLSKDMGSQVIGRLAEMRPDDMFHLFGPLEASAEELGIIADNIKVNPLISNVTAADLSAFDGFLFPSGIEDMSNIVLDMCQQAIPVIATDVGGLKETLGDNSIFFTAVSDDVSAVAAEFDRCMNGMTEMSRFKLLYRIVRAQRRVARLHSPKHHAAIVGKLLNGLPL